MGMIVDTFHSPLGNILLCSNGTHLTAVVFAGQRHSKTHIPLDAVPGVCPVLEESKKWLEQYFQGNVPHALPPIKLHGTCFQQQVWQQLLKIPYGQTVTYGELAKTLGCRSAQAVGGAIGRNPISILIPCHRVIGADGSLTGYAGGIEKKRFLLDFEKENGLPRVQVSSQ